MHGIEPPDGMGIDGRTELDDQFARAMSDAAELGGISRATAAPLSPAVRTPLPGWA